MSAWVDVTTGPLIQRYYDDGHSVRECAGLFGFSTASWHEAIKRGEVEARPGRKPLDEVFVAGTRRSRGHLKRRILGAGLKQNQCAVVSQNGWASPS